MRFPSVFSRVALMATGIAFAAVSSSSCRKAGQSSAVPTQPVEIAPELLQNRLADSPSTFLADQAASPVHWQPWNRETLDRASRANRLVFAVFALPQQADSAQILKTLNSDSSLVRDINDNFVPVLVDSDACREIGVLSSTLCTEIKQPFAMPLFVWLTPAGNPVAWIPAKARKGGLRELFDQSSNVVSRMWNENAESHAYVLNNSKADNATRIERMAKAAACPPSSTAPDQDALRALRQLSTFYDAGSHSFDNAGGLFPSMALELLSSASVMQGVSGDVAARCREAANGLAGDLSTSAMLDPLDGGIYSARRGGGWDLPAFNRDCASHARALIAFTSASRSTKSPRMLEQVLAGIDFAEKNYATNGDLFALGRRDIQPSDNSLWSMEDLEKALSADEMKVWVAVSALKGLGNIPIESDPNREQFRRNSLAFRVSPEAAAAKTGFEPTVARGHFESARKKILKLRQERSAAVQVDGRPHAVASFRMVSAYAAAYAATGDPALRKKAIESLDRAREAFAKGSNLQFFPGTADTLTGGRAFLYGTAIQAALDVADVTLDPALVSWSEDLSAVAAERFLDGADLREATGAQTVIGCPVSDRTMIYDDSSAGLLSAAEARLSKLGHPVAAAYATAVATLPTEAVERPILHADLVEAALIRHHAPVVVVAADAPAALKEAICRLPVRAVVRRAAVAADSVPAGQAKITLADGTTTVVPTADVLGTVILAGGPPR